MLHLPLPTWTEPPFTNRPAREPPTYKQATGLEASANALSSSTEFHYGLSTPPKDMTDLAFPLSHGGHGYKFPGPLHTNISNVPMAPSVSEPKVVTQGSRQQQPPSLTSQLPESEPKPAKESSIAIYLQVPSSICENGGSLADFAAQITCLFWFAKASKLKQIEDGASSPYYNLPPLDPESMPSIGFRKWMTTILSTTQVSRNVVLLALLFVYRLKKFNPSVRGKRGSEFRLMTIALMMGNKFLDDNTYTNKTWAEVSGIAIQEIHVMEVEFLSNVRYNLFVTKEEWEKWHSKLRIFAQYFDRASRMPQDTLSQQPRTPILQISPSLTPMSGSPITLPQPKIPTLPSPPATNSSGVSFPLPIVHSPATVEPLMNNRKRSWDGQADAHPVKKLAGPNNRVQPVSSHVLYPTPVPPLSTSACSTLSSMSTGTVGSQPSVRVPQLPTCQLPTPALTISTNPLPCTSATLSSQLPVPVARAMSAVYAAPGTWPQQPITPTSLAPLPINLPSVPAIIPDLNRRSSPYPINSSTDISPALSAYSSHTPTRLSPISVLDRNSPYRPVRAVNTLLYPPPSASLQQPRHLPMDMMHYQPLSKSITERRTGVLPYYPQPDGWSEQPYTPTRSVPRMFQRTA
uniref:Mucin n=1 Tax=Coccidioides posadasii RMSCC 3488 TaxID=454284 RepID=A0A0J6FQC8_COCPO|nr:hypothetical protein CPAG_07963 [Coccidioides posadasii RMSCC 3488]